MPQVLQFCSGLAILLIVVGCASNPPAGEPSAKSSNLAYLNSNFPESQFITTWGISNQSQRDAELDAKARISEEISSSIKAETYSVATAWMKDDVITDEQFLGSIVSTETNFDRAELIHIDQKLSGPDGKGGFKAFAFLDRGELGVVLTEAYDDNASVFRSQAESAMGKTDEPLNFTAPWINAKNRFEKMFIIVCQHRVVLHQSPIQFQTDRQLLHELEIARANMLSELVISVDLTTSSQIDTPAMESALTGAMANLGLNVQTGSCSTGKSLVLSLEPEVTWKKLMGTRFCQVRLLGQLQDCTDEFLQKPVVVEGQIMEGRGSNPSQSLARRVTVEKMTPLISQSLKNLLPILVPGN